MTTIADIFDLPERVHQGDYVLRLSEGVADAARTLADYVVAPQLVRCFEDGLSLIGSAVRENTSKGAYLHGSFGSGKSHFMAVLTLLLRGDPHARSIPELAGAVAKANAWTTGRRFLTAYGISRTDSNAIDDSHGLERHFWSLNPSFEPQPPAAANFDGALVDVFSPGTRRALPGPPRVRRRGETPGAPPRAGRREAGRGPSRAARGGGAARARRNAAHRRAARVGRDGRDPLQARPEMARRTGTQEHRARRGHPDRGRAAGLDRGAETAGPCPRRTEPLDSGLCAAEGAELQPWRPARGRDDREAGRWSCAGSTGIARSERLGPCGEARARDVRHSTIPVDERTERRRADRGPPPRGERASRSRRCVGRGTGRATWRWRCVSCAASTKPGSLRRGWLA